MHFVAMSHVVLHCFTTLLLEAEGVFPNLLHGVCVELGGKSCCQEGHIINDLLGIVPHQVWPGQLLVLGASTQQQQLTTATTHDFLMLPEQARLSLQQTT